MAADSVTARVLQLADTPEGVLGQWATRPIADLGEGDLLIRVTHTSVNYKDALAVTGSAPIARTLPLVAGIDAAGVVVEASGDHALGDPVVVTGFGLSETHNGGYAQYLRVPAGWAIPVPAPLTLADAMTLGTAGVTAALAIDRLEFGGLAPGAGPVAVTGASGGVGSLAVGMLARRGYEVIAFTGKADAADYLRSLGASEVRTRPPLGELKALGPKTWAGAFDSVGGQTLAWLASTMMPWSGIASYGNASGSVVSTSVMPFILRGVSIQGINSTWFPDELRARVWRRMATDLAVDYRAIGTIRPFVDVVDACREVLAGSVTGRIVIQVAD